MTEYEVEKVGPHGFTLGEKKTIKIPYFERREERINDENFAFFRGFKYALAFSFIFWSLLGTGIWYFKYHKKTSGYINQSSTKQRTTL